MGSVEIGVTQQVEEENTLSKYISENVTMSFTWQLLLVRTTIKDRDRDHRHRSGNFSTDTNAYCNML